MYGISDKVQFVSAKNKELYGGQEMIIQTEWPHIVARVVKFGCTQSQEQAMQQWIEKKEQGEYVVGSQTHRLFVELVGTLQDARRDRIEASKHEPIESYVQGILTQMAEYAVESLPEKQKYSISWDREIVTDDYYKKLRKERRRKKTIDN